MERNVLEFVDHLHEHFVTPCSINASGRYNVPLNPDEGYRYVDAKSHHTRNDRQGADCATLSDRLFQY